MHIVSTLSKLREPFEIVIDDSLIGERVVMLQEGRPITFESKKIPRLSEIIRVESKK